MTLRCFILLLWLLVEDRWLHRAKEHSMVDHFREGGGGGCRILKKLHSSECFHFPPQNSVALFSILNLWCRFYHLVLKEVVFFQEKKKNQAIMNVFLLLENFRTCYLPHVLILKDNSACIKYSPPVGPFHVLLFIMLKQSGCKEALTRPETCL